jgi:cyclic-di-GMP-binding protein
VAKESSFDVVSQVDMNEVRNAVQMAQKEIASRFDFKRSISKITLEDHSITLVSDDEGKLKSVIDVLEEKLVRRKVPLKALVYGKVEAALGGTVRQAVTLQAGISDEKAKAMNKLIRKEFTAGRHQRREGQGDEQAHPQGVQAGEGGHPGRQPAGVLDQQGRAAGGHDPAA